VFLPKKSIIAPNTLRSVPPSSFSYIGSKKSSNSKLIFFLAEKLVAALAYF
jgi:hypothetical protein